MDMYICDIYMIPCRLALEACHFLVVGLCLGIDMTALRGQDPEDKVASCLGPDDERRQWLSTIQQWAKEPRTEQAGCVWKWGIHPPICITLW